MAQRNEEWVRILTAIMVSARPVLTMDIQSTEASVDPKTDSHQLGTAERVTS